MAIAHAPAKDYSRQYVPIENLPQPGNPSKPESFEKGGSGPGGLPFSGQGGGRPVLAYLPKDTEGGRLAFLAPSIEHSG